MHDESERDDSSGGLREDDSLVGKVFDALDDEAAEDDRSANPVPAAASALREEAGESLEDSFKAEVDEPLVDDFDNDESPAATIPASPSRAAAERGLRGFLGLVGGALLSVAVALLILLWGLRRDPFAISTRLPEQLVFLLPPEFRTVSQRQSADIADEAAPAEDAFGIGD